MFVVDATDYDHYHSVYQKQIPQVYEIEKKLLRRVFMVLPERFTRFVNMIISVNVYSLCLM